MYMYNQLYTIGYHLSSFCKINSKHKGSSLHTSLTLFSDMNGLDSNLCPYLLFLFLLLRF